MRFVTSTTIVMTLLFIGLGTLATPQPVLVHGSAQEALRDGLDAPGSLATVSVPVTAEIRERQ